MNIYTGNLPATHAPYKTTKSAIHFPLDKELPILFLKELVKARMKKNDEEH